VRLKSGDRAWHSAYETKFESKHYGHFIYDICRLVCLAQEKHIGTPFRYLIYGAQKDIATAFFAKNYNTGAGTRDVLFNGILERDDLGGSKKVKLASLDGPRRGPFVSFAKEHSVSLPSMIETKLVGKTISGRYLCAVWQISAVKGSALQDHVKLLQ